MAMIGANSSVCNVSYVLRNDVVAINIKINRWQRGLGYCHGLLDNYGQVV